MKKKVLWVLGGLMLSVLVFTGCGEKEEVNNSPGASTSSTAETASTTSNGENEEIREVSEAEKRLTEGVVLTFMCDGKWEDDDKYVYNNADIERIMDDEKNGSIACYGIVNGLYLGNGDGRASFNDIPYFDNGALEDVVKRTKPYGISEEWWKKHNETDLTVSEIYYDEESNRVYSHSGIVFDMSCYLIRSYFSEDNKICVEYSASNDVDDGTKLNGIIKLTYSMDENRDIDMFEEATFDKK